MSEPELQSTVIVQTMEPGKPVEAPVIESRRPALDREDVSSLQSAVNALWEMANRDCSGDSYFLDKAGKCSCETCCARHAIQQIEKVAEPRLVSLQPERMRNPPERIYVEHWRKQNLRQPFLNHGFGLLELLLQPEGSKAVPEVSQRDATVATSIIQWLGTNCGMGFVQECERQIEKSRAERRDWFDSHTQQAFKEQHQTKGELYRAAHELASSVYSEDKQQYALSDLRTKIIELVFSFLEKYGGGYEKSVPANIPNRKRLITLEPSPIDLQSLISAGRDIP